MEQTYTRFILLGSVMSKSVLCADKEKDNKCGAMEQTYPRFILLGSVMSKKSPVC